MRPLTTEELSLVSGGSGIFNVGIGGGSFDTFAASSLGGNLGGAGGPGVGATGGAGGAGGSSSSTITQTNTVQNNNGYGAQFNFTF